MNVTKGVRIESVQYWASGPVQVVLTPLWLADDGSVVGTSGQESVSTTRDALTRRAVANGRADGQWGDKEVEEEVRIATRTEMHHEKVTRTITTMVASSDPTEAAVEKTEKVTTDEMVPRTTLRFADVTEIRWS